MNSPSSSPPPSCLTALTALEQDPLQLPPAVAAHLDQCPACAEARVLWLAMAEPEPVAAPQGYFEGLPFRVLRKLPARRSVLRRPTAFWLAAAALLAALGLGVSGFVLGRAVRAPMVEAAQPKPPADSPETTSETPFYEAEDPLTQLSNLSPQEADQALQRLQNRKAAPSGR